MLVFDGEMCPETLLFRRWVIIVSTVSLWAEEPAGMSPGTNGRFGRWVSAALAGEDTRVTHFHLGEAEEN